MAVDRRLFNTEQMQESQVYFKNAYRKYEKHRVYSECPTLGGTN